MIDAQIIDWPTASVLWLTNVTLNLGLFVGVGGAFFTTWVGGVSPPVSRIILLAIVLGLAATVSLFLESSAASEPVPSSVTLPIWLEAGAKLAAPLALVLGLLSLAGSAIVRRLFSLTALLGIGLSLAFSGHAGSADPTWLTRPAMFLHGLGIAYWVGALLPLSAALRETPSKTSMLQTFSATAPFAVFPLVTTGMLLSMIQLRSLDSIWNTTYGWILLTKIVLLGVLFAIAIVNRVALTESVQQGSLRAASLMRSIIRLEMAIIVLAGC